MFFGISETSFAVERTVGKVLVSSGVFYAINAKDEKRALMRPMPIFEKDRLITEQGKAQIWLLDGALFTLEPQTEFRVHEYVMEPRQKSSIVELLKGGFRTITGSIAKDAPNRYLVKTPVATIGVRGTHYWAFSSPKCVTEPTHVLCKFGILRTPGTGQDLVVSVDSKTFSLNDAEPAMRITAGIPQYTTLDELYQSYESLQVFGSVVMPFAPVLADYLVEGVPPQFKFGQGVTVGTFGPVGDL